jgi:hypothetical protein
MPRSHECLGRCDRRVGRTHVCPTCWARLPEHLRQAIASARRNTRASSVALHNADMWFTENPPQDLQPRAAS